MDKAGPVASGLTQQQVHEVQVKWYQLTCLNLRSQPMFLDICWNLLNNNSFYFEK